MIQPEPRDQVRSFMGCCSNLGLAHRDFPKRRSVQGGELLAEGEALDRELGMGAESRAKGGEQAQK